MAVKSCGFAIGNLRARENSMIKSNDLMQFLSAKNIDELASMYRDKGIGFQTSDTDIPDMLKDENEKLWKYLTEIAPDMAAFEPFIYENDFHNLKAVLKAVIRLRNYEDLLIVPADIDVSVIERAVKEKRFDLLPDYIRPAAEKGYEIMTQSGDSQLADGIIDAACLEAQLEKAKSAKNKTVSNVISVMVFYNNIKIALRAAKAKKSASFLEQTLTETGIISKKALINVSLQGVDSILDLLSSISVFGSADAVEYYKKSAGEFEKFVDNKIMETAKSCKYITMGIEPLVGYMLAKKAEIKDLRIIYSGVKTGQPQDKTKERLRDLYD